MIINARAADFLPHATPMVLLDQLIAIDDDSVHCQVSTAACGVLAPFLTRSGELPAWFGVEIIQPGMLLGGRGWRSLFPCFPAAATLDITMRLLMRDDRMGSFEGEIRHGECLLASGRLTTYQPTNAELEQLMSQGNQP
jgi:predicted hotdog family 3-hydroxylacyl-ACP dehydratase